MKLELPPVIYHRIIRSNFMIKRYIVDTLEEGFSFKEKKVLDFGCGTGSNCFIFDSNNYLGIDVDKDRINYAKKLYPNYSFMTIKDCKIPVKDNHFDFVCIFATLHHIPDDIALRYTKEFYRILKKGGKILAIEAYASKTHRFNNWFMDLVDRGEHIRSEDGYHKLFGKGFKIKTLKRFKTFFFYNMVFFSAEKK